MARALDDHGTAQEAIDFILGREASFAPGEERTFLEAWSEGDLWEWPEFYEWLEDRRLA